MKEIEELNIYRGSKFDDCFSEYISEEKFKPFWEAMRVRKYTVGDTNVSYRLINHWQSIGILPEGVIGDDGWRKFTYIENVWLQIANRLRKFGIGLDKIALVKKGIMDWNKKEECYPIFEYYVFRAWATSDDLYVVVSSSGQAVIADTQQIEMSKIGEMSKDMLLISIKSILIEMGRKVVKPRTLFALSEEQMELLHQMQFEEGTEFKIKVDENGDIREIESEYTEVGDVKDEAEKKVRQDKVYGSIVKQYEDGVCKSAKVVKRKKFKK
jgi:DNA-binding transcriptional MerR regulator